MKAWVLEDVNEFNLQERVASLPDDMSVLVRVEAAGICGSDIQRVYENGAHKMPLIIGHEFSGVVEKIGTRVDSHWIGKRVGVFPLIPCKKCQSCLKKNYEMCENYSYLGSRCDGGFAEYAVVPAWNLIELPDDVTFEQAAMLEPMAVAVHAIRQLKLEPTDKIAVCGLGTIGQLIVMFLKDMGYENIYALGKSELQRKAFVEAGLPEENYFDISLKEKVWDFIKEKTSGAGFDAYFDCVGKNETISQGIEFAAPAGKLCMVGNPYSDIAFEKATYWKILRKQLLIHGTWNSSFLGIQERDAIYDDWHYVLERLSVGQISPERLITHRFDIESLQQGFEIMRQKKEPYLKIMCISSK